MSKFPLKILQKIILKDLGNAPNSDNEEEAVDGDTNGVRGKCQEQILMERPTENPALGELRTFGMGNCDACLRERCGACKLKEDQNVVEQATDITHQC